jgi:hypothetical protein
MNALTLDDVRCLGRAAGFDWSPAEAEALRPALERSLALLRSLDDLPLGDLEPTIQYRIL